MNINLKLTKKFCVFGAIFRMNIFWIGEKTKRSAEELLNFLIDLANDNSMRMYYFLDRLKMFSLKMGKISNELVFSYEKKPHNLSKIKLEPYFTKIYLMLMLVQDSSIFNKWIHVKHVKDWVCFVTIGSEKRVAKLCLEEEVKWSKIASDNGISPLFINLIKSPLFNYFLIMTERWEATASHTIFNIVELENFVRAAIILLKKIEDLGFCHTDVHSDNFVTRTVDGKIEYRLIDWGFPEEETNFVEDVLFLLDNIGFNKPRVSGILMAHRPLLESEKEVIKNVIKSFNFPATLEARLLEASLIN